MLQIDTLPAYTAAADSAAGEEMVCAYDTLFKATDRPAPVRRQSLFTHHQMQVVHHAETPIVGRTVSGWFLVVIALSMTLTVLYMRKKQLTVLRLLHAAINMRVMARTLRESNLTHTGNQAPIAVVALAPLALIGCFCAHPYSQRPLMDFAQYLLILGCATTAYFVRNGIIRLIGNAFDNSETANAYIANNYMFHLLYGVAASAFAFFICYTDNMGTVFLYILGGVIGLLFILRFFRGMKLILTYAKYPKVYFFYYLCSLELLPILILIKLALQ